MSMMNEFLKHAVEYGASDIHLKVTQKPIFRINGALTPVGDHALNHAELTQIVEDILPEHMTRRYKAEHEADFSLDNPEIGRFRVNLFHSQGSPCFTLRHVKTEIPTIQELHLPPVIQDLAMAPRGIVLAGGTTGSGKSTTLAAMINAINISKKSRVITIEDPVEYMFTDIKSVISQREVGHDTLSFHAALKYVLRQDPDCIMVGEMRDSESFMAALAAANTGHLVFSTLHADNAAQSIQRILDFFPSTERDQIRKSLASNLRGIICQRLVPGIKHGVMPAVEVMVNNSTVQKMLEKDQLDKLHAAIETGADSGMQTFNQAIYKLIKSGEVTEQNGLRFASNPEALIMSLKGIELGQDRRIIG